MEQGGMRWTLLGAEAMLNVRAVCASSEWAAFHTGGNRKTGKRTIRTELVANYTGFRA